ncbi:ThuA domain-containing protein [Paenibacillus silvisoli]|uniref:ThuA domain-containing protein n=1 Tax=Paenibacillus silvisoli TaxID=3110539 RepID=UPI002805CD7C|nr:ThuA domain-containing protein [Paenibacillus silvisoli]
MERIPTLLITGEHNHDWQRSSAFCKQLLEESGRFAVDVVDGQSPVLSDEEQVRRYRLIFLDYNGEGWSPSARDAILTAVSGGTGLVSLHGSNNAFPGWTEYARMIGLVWGEGSGHGEFHEFEVQISDPAHPITAGVEPFRTWDELYHGLRSDHDVPFHVLATAYSDPAKGGTGLHEPVMLVLRYGSGRVFQHALGHVWPGDPDGDYKGSSMIAFHNNGFQQSLLRGCEWAATGAVTPLERSNIDKGDM